MCAASDISDALDFEHPEDPFVDPFKDMVDYFGTSDIAKLPELCKLSSPVNYIDERLKGRRIFITQGTEDEIVPFEQGLKLVDTCKKAGMDVTWMPVLNAGHGFDKRIGLPTQPGSQVAVVVETVNWIGTNFRPAKVPSKFWITD